MNKVIVVIFTFLYAIAGFANTMQEAVENPARTEKDRNLDAKRKPSEVLEFFGIKPGMKVLDVFGGGGYYSEIVSLMAVMFRVAGAREFRDFARLSLVAGALAVVVIDGGDLIWWQAPIEWKVWQIIYDFTVFLLAGHLLGIFMKQESANSGS